MHDKIVKDFPQDAIHYKNKYEIVGNFIKRHFLKKDNIFDVIILNDGKFVKFNIEE